jgi:hypothetical protein
LSLSPLTFQHKIFQFLFIKNQNRREETASKEAKPPRPSKQTKHNVSTQPTEKSSSLLTSQPTSVKIKVLLNTT